MKIVIAVVVGLAVIVLIGAQFGLFSGKRPVDLGVSDGRLKAPSPTRNSVSSQAVLHPGHPQLDYAQIEPLRFIASGVSASMQALTDVLSTMPGIRIIKQQPDYIYAEARTRWMNYVDDLEFWVNPEAGVIEVRSASRLGSEDFGVNRKRIEKIRAAYLARSSP